MAIRSIRGPESSGAVRERSERTSAERPEERERPRCRKRGPGRPPTRNAGPHIRSSHVKLRSDVIFHRRENLVVHGVRKTCGLARTQEVRSTSGDVRETPSESHEPIGTEGSGDVNESFRDSFAHQNPSVLGTPVYGGEDVTLRVPVRCQECDAGPLAAQMRGLSTVASPPRTASR